MRFQAERHGRERLFVYGTIRPGGGHPISRALAHNGRWLGSAAIRGSIERLGAYPALRLRSDARWVGGEVFEITGGRRVWRVLDLYEGCHEDPPDYVRQRVPVWLCAGNAGRWINAWCYVMNAGGRGKTARDLPRAPCG